MKKIYKSKEKKRQADGKIRLRQEVKTHDEKDEKKTQRENILLREKKVGQEEKPIIGKSQGDSL